MARRPRQRDGSEHCGGEGKYPNQIVQENSEAPGYRRCLDGSNNTPLLSRLADNTWFFETLLL